MKPYSLILAKVCKVGDQTDVRTFRGLDRAHSSVVGVVNVTNLESGTVSGKTARAKCGKTSLVSKLSKRVVLIHELRQRRGAEELLDSRSYGTDIDKALRCNGLNVLSLNVHSFTNAALHTGKTDPELVLEQLTNGTDTSVAKVVDIVNSTNALAEVDEVADRGRRYRQV